jgi:uncharacterized protein YnzC (UPF0291/DUF896 family)
MLYTTDNTPHILSKTADGQTLLLHNVERMEQNRFRRRWQDDIKTKLKKQVESVGWI